jgi:hypothetical protein
MLSLDALWHAVTPRVLQLPLSIDLLFVTRGIIMVAHLREKGIVCTTSIQIDHLLHRSITRLDDLLHASSSMGTSIMMDHPDPVVCSTQPWTVHVASRVQWCVEQKNTPMICSFSFPCPMICIAFGSSHPWTTWTAIILIARWFAVNLPLPSSDRTRCVLHVHAHRTVSYRKPVVVVAHVWTIITKNSEIFVSIKVA